MNLIKIENKTLEEIVPIYSNENNNVKVVNARELYTVLGVKKDFSNWIKSNLKSYKEAVNIEDTKITSEGELEFDYFVLEIQGDGPRKRKEYILTLDTAKELAMMSKCENGRMVRKYFIEVEKTLNKVVATLADEDKSDEVKIAEALVLAQGVLSKTQEDLLKSERNKAYNKKINVQLRRKVRELETELEKAHNNPNTTHAELEEIESRLSKAEEQASYWEGAYAVLEERLDTKETQLTTILTVRKDGRKFFNLLSAKHASSIPERDANKKSMRANIFRKESIEKCKDVNYSHTFSANFIEKIHPLSIPIALYAYFNALKARLEDKFEEVVGEDLIKEVSDFLEQSEDGIEDVLAQRKKKEEQEINDLPF